MAKLAKKELSRLRAAKTPQTARFEKYRNDPANFFVDVLGITPWERQREILLAIAEHPKVAVRSGHKVSKSNSAAGAALWWWATRRSASVVLTSSTDDQIRDILWKELKKLYRGARISLGGSLHESHRSGLIAPDGRAIIGRSTNRTDNMGGHSGAELLFIADEASGIEEEIFDAMEGNCAGGARLVMFGNPIRTSGRFYQAFTSMRQFWHTIHVSSTDTPNVKEGRVVIEGLATRQWVEEETKKRGGPGHPWWDVRVGGNFPSQGENTVIGLALVEKAMKNWREPMASDGELEVGVDVARFGGDETVIQAVRGRCAYPPVVIHHQDGPNVAGKVLEVVRELRVMVEKDGASHPEKPRVKIDAIGVGSSPFDILARSDEVKAMPVNAGESATEPSYHNIRSQLWFAAREWLKEGGMFKQDDMLEAELVAPLYKSDVRGRIEVESKDDIKKKLHPVRSPDRADALCLAVFNPPEAYVGTIEGDWMSNR